MCPHCVAVAISAAIVTLPVIGAAFAWLRCKLRRKTCSKSVHTDCCSPEAHEHSAICCSVSDPLDPG